MNDRISPSQSFILSLFVCCVSVLVATESVLASGETALQGSPSDPAPEIPATCLPSAGYDYEPVGCPCDMRTGSSIYLPDRGAQEKGERFCDVPTGATNIGTVRECISDDAHQCPSSMTDKRADFWSCECSKGPFQYFPPFCENNQCHSCRNDDDCRYNGLGGPLYTSEEINNQKCLLPKYAAAKRKRCHYCKPLGGTTGKVFTIAVLPTQTAGSFSTLDAAKTAMGWVLNSQPFGYLFKNGFIQFQFVDVPTQHVKFPLDWEEETGSDGQPYTRLITAEQEQEIKSFAETVCGHADYTLVLVKDWMSSLVQGYTLLGSPRIAFAYPREGIVVHEVGHVVGKLGEEYYLGKDDREASIKNVGHQSGTYFENIDTLQGGECPKFRGFGLAKHLCYPIPKNLVTIEPGYRTSTPSSVMDLKSSSNNYNLVSCGAIIANVAGGSTKDGIATCLREQSIWTDLVLGPPS